MSSMYEENTQGDCSLNKVQELEQKIRLIKGEIDLIQQECPHVLEPHVLKDGEKLGHKRCPKCEKYYNGWWCEKSPTTFCDYEQDDGTFDPDCCRYCGAPSERK